MDLAKAKILLDKINTLFNSISSDADNIAQIEKDLMRNYIQQLYAELLETNHATEKKPTPTSPRPKPVEKVEVIQASPKPKETTPPPSPVEENKEKPVEKKPPRVIELSDTLKEEAEEKPVPAPEKPKARPASPVSDKEALETLFETPKAKELSDKLSELPISDLTKAMGLNEKIYTINELFGGNQERFNTTMEQLNGCADFGEARNLLINGVAAENGWAEKSNLKKAKNFIKLVRRRYQ